MASSGRVCVSDFGLSRMLAELPAEPPADGFRDAPLTLAHAGTPRYMSPEQHRGEAATPKSDQFSFCVTLYEALYGEHPFGPDADRARWDLRPAPAKSRVPAWLRRLVVRGLREGPQEIATPAWSRSLGS